MILIFVLSLLRLELEVQSNLVTLINDTAIAVRHLAGVEVHHTGNVSEIFICASDHFLRSVGLGRVGPKNYDVGKHFVSYERFRALAQPATKPTGAARLFMSLLCSASKQPAFKLFLPKASPKKTFGTAG
jgi:hypothetical protein